MFINSVHILLLFIYRIHQADIQRNVDRRYLVFSHHHLSPFQRVARTSKMIPINWMSVRNTRLVLSVQICCGALIVPPSPMSVYTTLDVILIIILVLCCKLHIVVVGQWITCNKMEKKNTTVRKIRKSKYQIVERRAMDTTKT